MTEGPHYPDLAGKVAVITGGSRGIGAATARAFATSGARTCLIGRDEDALAGVVDEIKRRGGEAISIRADCTLASDLQRAAAIVSSDLGAVDILAAFAGGMGMPVPTVDETPEHWRAIVESDLTSTFLTVHSFLPAMVDREDGAIVTMSSAAARQPAQSAAAYAAAKAGVVAFSRHLANELAGRGVRVNCVAPSAIENDRMRTWMTAEQRSALGSSFPLGRLGQPADVAAATLFLASEASSWITGATLDIAGGKIMV